MMKEELGLIKDEKEPMNSSVSTFVGFNLIGLIPLIPFMVYIIIGFEPNSESFIYSSISVVAAFFLVGMIKGKIVRRSKIRAGLYTVIIGGVAALVAYFVGYGLHFLVL